MSGPGSSGSSQRGSHTSRYLLARAQSGNATSLGRLLARYLPGLRRWAHGRLHRQARAGLDTSDIIQDVVLRSIPKITSFESRGKRALGAYLRRAVQNRIHDEHRRMVRHPTASLPDDSQDHSPSILDHLLREEVEQHYRAALDALSTADRELIVGHLELGYSHQQLGCMTGRSPNAARMALQRAIARLVARMRHA